MEIGARLNAGNDLDIKQCHGKIVTLKEVNAMLI